MFRKGLFWLHLIAGVLTGVVILIMSVTGALLTYERQMVAYAERSLYSQAAPGVVRLGPDELLATRKEGAPLPSSLTLPLEEGAPASISFGRGNTLFLNPYTGEELGKGSKLRDFFREVTSWHRWLANRDIGKPFTGVSNLAFLFLAVSGIYLWWPRHLRWKNFKPVLLFNRKLSGKARDFNWHNVIGFWSAPILIILTATGAVFSYSWANNLVYTLTGTEAPPQRGGPGGSPGAGAGKEAQKGGPSVAKEGEGKRGRGQSRGAQGDQPGQGTPRGEGGPTAPAVALPAIGLAPFFEAAKQQAPNWVAITLNLPAPGAKTVSASIEESTAVHPYARSSATFHAESAAIEKWEPFESLNRGRKARTWVRALHTGEAGGIIGQTLAGLASAGGAVLVWSGFALSWRRFFGKKRKQAKENRNEKEVISAPNA